ncbi:unnamed protein product [Dovyalis caffra]|uniref:Uncharacterized protein n=1 Tax=Dovyalis caffra TaxID=77055 RepID=A0AAV1R0Y1_9ROSI|nr:unnamed protein product [Dovyalis caffra]
MRSREDLSPVKDRRTIIGEIFGLERMTNLTGFDLIRLVIRFHNIAHKFAIYNHQVQTNRLIKREFVQNEKRFFPEKGNIEVSERRGELSFNQRGNLVSKTKPKYYKHIGLVRTISGQKRILAKKYKNVQPNA